MSNYTNTGIDPAPSAAFSTGAGLGMHTLAAASTRDGSVFGAVVRIPEDVPGVLPRGVPV